MIQREAFEAWLTHPVTKEVRQAFRDRRAEIMERWAEGEPMEPAAQVYAQVYGDLANLSYDDIKEEEHEQAGPSA